MEAKINKKEIILSSNDLEFIPSEIFGLENRKILNVSRNKIKVGVYKEEKEFEEGKVGIVDEPYDGITENIKQLNKLEELYLNDNEILEIPEYLTDMTTLKVLDLSSNNIEKISNSLLKLTNLKKLNLANNPVSQIKGFSLKESPKEIIEFLLLNQEKTHIPLNEAKLLVVGDENAGKSSLVERMVHNKFNAEYNSTKGIDISQYPISSDIVSSYCFNFYVEPNIKVNIWDFAGQEITYQVHNLFMSKESLYLLVIDGQKEDNIVENFDWLETISTNADNPPIIIVVTKHENNRSHEIDEEKYIEEFPNIEKIHYVSSKENFGFCELKQSILVSLSKFSKQKIPKSYEVVKRKIEERKIEKLKQDKYMLSADDFDAICHECDLLNKKNNIISTLFKERDNIRTIFNDIGVIIGMDNDDMHVINPTKMIDAIYEIIRSQTINDNGELDLKKEKDRHYNWIMEFLVKNKIAFKIDDLKVMIPTRLPVKRPKRFLKNNYIRDDKVYGLNFRYRYKRFKKSVFFDFLIQIQEDVNDIKAEYWANGIAWKHDEFQAVVLASKVDRTIDIHISKDTEESRKFLTKIRKKFDEINRGKWGIVEEIAVVDADDNMIHYKSYRFLKAKQKNKDSEVELNIKANPKTFNLSSLLDRYEYIEEEIEEDNTKPLIITEGKTDWKHLKKALERFKKDGLYNDLDIAFKEYEDEIDMGEDNLNHMLKANIKDKPSRKKIFIFDRDTKHKDVREYQKVEFTKHLDMVYSFCIPEIDDLDGICIEFYYDEQDLITKDKNGRRLFLGKEFIPKANGNSKCGQFQTRDINKAGKELEIIDNAVYKREDLELKNSIALSKNDFAENIFNEVDGFDNFNIENFKSIFNVIEKIVNKEKLNSNKEEKAFQIINNYNKNVVKIIQEMQNGSIENFEEIKIELAKELKKIMQQSAKTWGNAKGKALPRKEYIQAILNGGGR
jgi:small GTP-binding protein